MEKKLQRIFSLFILFIFAANLAHSQIETRDSAQDQTIRLTMVFLGEDARVIIMPVCKAPLKGISFVHVHEDENTAVEAITSFIDSSGLGCFVTLKHGMGRNIAFNLHNTTYKFDPNRIYTSQGRMETLKKSGAYSDSADAAVKGLSDLFTRKYIDSNRLVVALHNNTNEGGLSIKSYQKGGPYANDASRVHASKKEDIDNFFYTTSDRAFDFFKKRGFNVMLQNNATVTDDGSLSVYAGMKKIDYINIETEHGQVNNQKRMIAAIMQYIGEYFPESLPQTGQIPTQQK